MAIPVIDFSKLDGEERAATLAQIANGCEEWGFFQVPFSSFSLLLCEYIMATYLEYCLIVSLCVLSQLVNHGISEELLERVKKVSDEFFKNEREENFKKSTLVQSLNADQKLENVDWEDVITLLDDNEWPSKTPGFK